MTTWAVADLPPRLEKRVTIDAQTGCWRVGGYRDRDGYAYFGGEGAHRFAYKLLIGPIPDSRPVIDHVLANGCAWRDCVNVNGHLEAVTIRENTVRGTSFAAVNAAKDRCDHGHEFDLLNTYWYGNRRCCRKCNLAAVARYTERQRQASLGTLQLAA